MSQSCHYIAEGIHFYSTAGHGGYKLSPELNKQVPLKVRQSTWGGLGMQGWYEEDCDALIVVVTFPQHFPETSVKRAKECLELMKERAGAM
jgi:hypothetical protein